MRKIVILAAVLGFSVVSNARDALDGCGLGWDVTADETMIATTTRATTNAVIPPSFGMTTGTLGCKQIGIAANETEAVNYVVNNFTNLKQQLAVGQGEYVSGLNEVMNCNASAVQSQYDTVVAPAQDGVSLYKSLKAVCG